MHGKAWSQVESTWFNGQITSNAPETDQCMTVYQSKKLTTVHQNLKNWFYKRLYENEKLHIFIHTKRKENLILKQTAE